jgi:methionyl-tRNA synthetase
MDSEEKIREFVNFQINRKVKNLYKQFLIMLEDWRAKNPEIHNEDFERARKKVLDAGNDAIREIEEAISKLEIRLK